MTTCREIDDLIAPRAADLLDDDETHVAAHVAACDACAARVAALESAFADLREPAPAVPAELWSKIAPALDAPSAEPEGSTPLSISLSCCYCRDKLARDEAAYCGSCLAPHHEECFRAHGRCSAPGCEETRIVRPRVAEPEPRRRRFAWVASIAAGLLVAATTTGVFIVQRQRARDAEQAAFRARLLELTDRIRMLVAEGRHEEAERAMAELEASLAQARKDSDPELREFLQKMMSLRMQLQDERLAAVRIAAVEKKKELEQAKREAERALDDEKKRERLRLEKQKAEVEARRARETAPLSEVIQRFSERVGKDVLVAPSAREAVVPAIDLAEDWRDALGMIARAAKCRVVTLPCGTPMIERVPEVEFSPDDKTVSAVARRIARAAGLNAVVTRDADGPVRPFRGRMSWVDAFDQVYAETRLDIVRAGDVILVAKKAPEGFSHHLDELPSEWPERDWPESAFGFVADDATVGEVAASLSNQCGPRIVVPDRIEQRVTFTTHAAPWRDVVTFLARVTHSRMECVKDVVRIVRRPRDRFVARGVPCRAWIEAVDRSVKPIGDGPVDLDLTDEFPEVACQLANLVTAAESSAPSKPLVTASLAVDGAKIDVVVRGYAIRGADPCVFMNGEVYKVGEVFKPANAKLVAIEEDRIELVIGTRRVKIELPR